METAEYQHQKKDQTKGQLLKPPAVLTWTILSTLCLGVSVSLALAETRLDWRAMQLTDLRLPGSGGQTYAAIWRDELKINNAHYAIAGDLRFAIGNAPATEAHIVVRSRHANRHAVLSVLNTYNGCSVAATDSDGSTIKRCPAKLALFRGSEVEMIDVGTACYVEHGEMPDTIRNTAVAAYDVESASIRLAVIFQGKITDACLVNIPLPPPKS